MTEQARRAAILAFVWHSAEAALVIAITIGLWRDAPIPLGALVLLAVVGWAWSLAHLPGKGP